MSRYVQTIPQRGLRFRSSPLDGQTVGVFPAGTELEVLAEENWLRVRSPSGRVGFVSADFVEPVTDTTQPETFTSETTSVEIVPFEHPRMSSERPIRIEVGFRNAMTNIAATAEQCDVQVYVTSSLRRPGERVDNAIVTPAKLSNHHIGHAIDVNIVHDGIWYNSRRLRTYPDLPRAIKKFIDNIRHEHKLRWGGMFRAPDPVHIDDNLNHEKPEQFEAMVLALWGRRIV